MLNKVIITGTVDSINYSHSTNEQSFYEMILKCKRKSGAVDIIKVITGENRDDLIGLDIKVTGTLRTHMDFTKTIGKLNIFIFSSIIEVILERESDIDLNNVELEGVIHKEPILRKTPKDKDICDLMIVNNYKRNKKAYVPTIVWGREAIECGNLTVGNVIKLEGRLQSRIYQKNHENGEIEYRIANELCVKSIEKVN